MKLSLVFIILLTYSRVFCSETSHIMSFCSPNLSQLKVLKTNLFFLKTDKDKIFTEGLCIQLNTISSRGELFYKYIKSKQPLTKITTLNTLLDNTTCKLRIRKTIMQDTQDRLLQNQKQQIKILDKKLYRNNEETISFSTLGKTPTKVIIENSTINITCTKKRNKLYHIGLVSQSKLLAINAAITTQAGVWKKIGDYNSKGFNKNKKIGITNNEINQQSSSIKLSIHLRVETK